MLDMKTLALIKDEMSYICDHYKAVVTDVEDMFL